MSGTPDRPVSARLEELRAILARVDDDGNPRLLDALPVLLDIAEAAEAMWRYDAGGTAEYEALRAALDRLNAQ